MKFPFLDMLFGGILSGVNLVLGVIFVFFIIAFLFGAPFSGSPFFMAIWLVFIVMIIHAWRTSSVKIRKERKKKEFDSKQTLKDFFYKK